MESKDEIMIVSQETLVNKIYTIRGQKVMLDFELAEIYGYETKNFNRQVKNNNEKFEGEDFDFSAVLRPVFRWRKTEAFRYRRPELYVKSEFRRIRPY